MTLSPRLRPSGLRLWRLGCAVGVAGILACASVPRGGTVLYSMPDDPRDALAPQSADPGHAGELAEGALYLLNPELPGGPDYMGAARMCLLAAETADPVLEQQLRYTCHQVAARAALRSGDRDLYLKAIDGWEGVATRTQRATGELAVHRAIRDRLRGEPYRRVHLPPDVARLISPPEGNAR